VLTYLVNTKGHSNPLKHTLLNLMGHQEGLSHATRETHFIVGLLIVLCQ
jgi:hypothetical protein